MYEKFGQFINGKWQKSLGGETYNVINPATEEVIGKASKANKEDIELALKSAEKILKEAHKHDHDQSHDHENKKETKKKPAAKASKEKNLQQKQQQNQNQLLKKQKKLAKSNHKLYK